MVVMRRSGINFELSRPVLVLSKESVYSVPLDQILCHFKRLQMGMFGFSQKETGAKSVAMTTT